MNSPSSLSVIIPAAGIGSRMASDIPKQYLKIAGTTVLTHSINAFIEHPLINDIVICLHPDDNMFNTLKISKHPKVHNIIGGHTRAESVLNGLRFVQQEIRSHWVLVHDAARPGLSQIALDRLINARTDHSGAILALPVVDTIKLAHAETKSGASSTIESTIDRNRLWQAQTPQMFHTQRLLTALTQALSSGLNVTDEASAIEHLGDKVALIEGETANFKITHPQDLDLAAFYLAQAHKKREPT